MQTCEVKVWGIMSPSGELLSGTGNMLRSWGGPRPKLFRSSGAAGSSLAVARDGPYCKELGLEDARVVAGVAVFRFGQEME